MTHAGKHGVIDDVHNVHPFWHLRGHPLWRRSLDKIGQDDYNDFPDHPPLYPQHNQHSVDVPASATGAAAASDEPAAAAHDATSSALSTGPRIFETLEYLTDEKFRHSELANACEQICALAKNNPAANAFLKKELEKLYRMVEDIRDGRDPHRDQPYRPPLQVSSKRKGGRESKEAHSNRSKLKYSGSSGSKKKGGVRRSKVQRKSKDTDVAGAAAIAAEDTEEAAEDTDGATNVAEGRHKHR